MSIDVLVVGSGGREHALAWKLAQSPRVGRLLAAPGNPGIARLAECVPVPVGDLDGLVDLARERAVGLVVVGPEAPLADGLADRLRTAGIPTFGPSAPAARIESSKAYARDLMARMGVPQPGYGRFQDAASAAAHLDRLEAARVEGVVVKASGLAAGKGAIVCRSLDEARAVVREMLVEHGFGHAGEEIVIEERLEGEEASLLVLTDGCAVVPLLPAQDYKRAYDGDRTVTVGGHEILTGGMGSYAPAPLMTPQWVEEALATIVRPVLRGLEEDGHPFQGCLYAGLMKTAAGLKVIEFNCRFGDPETQAILPLLDEDLLELLLGVAGGQLEERPLRWRPGCAVNVVMASGGYPSAYHTGKPIHGLPEAEAVEGVVAFHAGTAIHDHELVTGGGRVLSITGTGPDFAAAMESAYKAVERVQFEGRQFRTDIGARVRDKVLVEAS
jgi:phosphoribosylamine--glycine ligase